MEEPRPEAETESPPSEALPEEQVSLASAFGTRSPLSNTIQTLLLLILIFVALNLLTDRFQVLGASMEPALYDGQHVIVSQITYWIQPPQRGDIVVFHPPLPAEDYIKRIIGLPGEEVEIRAGQVWIDGLALEEPYIINASAISAGPWVLANDEYFVLGDNRNNSSDSHTWGPLPEENIIGRAWIRYWPPEEWGTVANYAFPEPVIQED